MLKIYTGFMYGIGLYAGITFCGYLVDKGLELYAKKISK